MATRNEILKALTVMASIMPGGERISKDAAEVIMGDLDGFNPDHVLAALTSCRKEMNRFPSIAEIISRVQTSDGRPGVEEAWALAPKKEGEACFMNDEIGNAWSAADALLGQGGDMIAARMAFKEVYERTVKENRSRGVKPTWWLSRAHGPGSEHANSAALRVGIEKKRIHLFEALKLLPELSVSDVEQQCIGLHGEGRLSVGEIAKQKMILKSI